MTLLYRILGVFINTIALMLAASMIVTIPVLFSSPIGLLSAFLMTAIILYCWFSLQFQRKVLHKREVVNRSLRDYVRVNGIVALVFSVIIILEGVILVAKPGLYTEALSKMNMPAPTQNLAGFFVMVAVYGITLFVHINWTFLLMKKNSGYFQ